MNVDFSLYEIMPSRSFHSQRMRQRNHPNSVFHLGTFPKLISLSSRGSQGGPFLTKKDRFTHAFFHRLGIKAKEPFAFHRGVAVSNDSEFNLDHPEDVPLWASSSQQTMSRKYPYDHFEIVTRKTQYGVEVKIQCFDCPGMFLNGLFLESAL